MEGLKPMISLGFSGEKVPAGTHICQIFSDDDERNDSLLKFLVSGLQSGERTACFSEKVDDKTINEFFTENGLSFAELSRQGAVSLSGARDVYFEDNRFDPERMLDLLTNFYHDSIASGYAAARVIGEMSPEVLDLPGGERLLEYESRVSLLLRDVPVTSVCQYDAHGFDGATIMDILKVHPHMIVRGAVIHNPFFIPPEEFLR
ncbi:MAG: MEDS domain-containing protein [Desulfobacterales bacterium]|nr:MEDS domain-containing protein [Desulfobacterales bacterium]